MNEPSGLNTDLPGVAGPRGPARYEQQAVNAAGYMLLTNRGIAMSLNDSAE